jgi:PKD repeat protein
MKFALKALNVLVIVGLLGVAGPASAAALTSSQVQAVVSLLQSFGVDTGTISNVEAALGASSSYNGNCLALSYNLYAGMTDAQSQGEVSQLQAFLGVSPTDYFGPLTQQAVQNYQASRGIVSYGSPDTTGWGFVGPQTRYVMSCNSYQPQPKPQPQPPTPPPAPQIFSASPTSGTAPLTVTFTGSSGSISFGDGYSANAPSGSTITHTYTSAGTYTATSNGMWATITVGGSTSCDPCVDYSCRQPGLSYTCPAQSNFSANPTSGVAPLTVAFTGVNTGVTSPVINFGDGSSAGPLGCSDASCSSYFSVAHTYSQAGTYSATLTDNGLAVDSASVAVSAAQPSGSFSATPSSGSAPLQVSFEYPITPAQENNSYSVDFGDGQSSVAQWACAVDGPGGCFENVSHTYTSGGTYTATLTSGGVTIGTVTISVSPTVTACPVYTFPACTTGQSIPQSTDANGCTVPAHYNCTPN